MAKTSRTAFQNSPNQIILMTYRIILSLLILACSVGRAAERRDSLYAVDPLYLQLYGGINKSMNENMPGSEMTLKPMAGGAFLGIGKEWSRLWGWRATIGYDINKSRNVPKCENSETWSWKDIEAFGDITYDISDVFVRRKHNVNVKAFAGVGGLWAWGYPQDVPLSYTEPYSRESKMHFGVRAGLLAQWQLTPALAVGCELAQTVTTDGFNGVKGKSTPFDGRANLSIGITWTPSRMPRKEKILPPVIYAPEYREKPDVPYIIPYIDTEERHRLEGKAYLCFPVDRTEIYPKYMDNPKELQKIRNTVEAVTANPKHKIKGIYLHGYASPESPYSHNTFLARERTKSLRGYLMATYGISESIISCQYTPEDWKSLRLYVSDSLAMADSEAGRYTEEILSVIDGVGDADSREQKMKGIANGVPYSFLLKNVYPILRRTDYVVEYAVHRHTMAEIREMIYVEPENLSVDDIMRYAMSFPEGSDERYEACVIAAKTYPADKVANYNAACVCLESKRLRDAKRYLRKINDMPEAEKLYDILQKLERR